MGTSALDDVLGRSQSRKQTALDEVLDTAPSPERVYGSATPAKPITITAQAPSALEQGLARRMSPTAAQAAQDRDESQHGSKGNQIAESLYATTHGGTPFHQAPAIHIVAPRRTQFIDPERINARTNLGMDANLRPRSAEDMAQAMLAGTALSTEEAAIQPVVAASDLGARVVQGGANILKMGGVPYAKDVAEELQRFRDTANRITKPTTDVGNVSRTVSRAGANFLPYMTLPLTGGAGIATMTGLGALEKASDNNATATDVLESAAIGGTLGAVFEGYNPVKRAIAKRLNAFAETRGFTPGWKVPSGARDFVAPTPTVQYGGAVGPFEPELSSEIVNNRLARAAEQAPVLGAEEIVPGLAYDARSPQLQSARKRSIARTGAPLEYARRIAVSPEEAAQLRQAGADASNRALPVVNENAVSALEKAAQEGANARTATQSPIIRTRTGAIAPEILQALGGTGAGAFAGGMVGDTPEDRIRNAALGGLAGAFAPSAMRRLVREEIPSTAGQEWLAQQTARGEQRGVASARSVLSQYPLAGSADLLPSVTAIDKPFQRSVADWFDQAQSDPTNPAVISAYRKMADETRQQFQHMLDNGVKVEFTAEDPYKNSAEMMRDLAENNRLKVFSSQEGHHPILSPDETNMFRAVHDYFGHAPYGNQFGPIGEENAYRVHSAMYSPEARQAMAAETRAQNSWVNVQPENIAKPGARYADQKAVLVPQEMLGDYSRPSGFKAYDIGGAVGDAFKQWSRQDATGRAIRGATIVGTGVGLGQSDDATARKIGTALMVGGGTYGLGGFTSETGKAFGDLAERVFAPASRTAETEAMSHIFRANQGDARRAFEQSVAGTEDFAKFLNQNLTAGQRMMYIDDIEKGRAFATNRLKQGTGLIREMLDNTRNQIQALDVGKLKTFYENYFPHIWEDPRSVGQAAQDAIAQATGRRPLGGARSFLKQRTITDTFSGMFPQGVPENLAQLDEQALRAEVARQGGLMPPTTDPIQLALIKTREMQKFLMDVKSIQDGERQGIIQLVTEPSLAPEGWVRINNPLGTVTGSRDAAGKAVITGQYYAPAPVQQLIDNYLSPGLRGNKAFDMYRTVGNGLNQMQLGLSAFHLGMTSVDAIVSQNALAIEKLAAGDIADALKLAVTSPAAPVLNYLRGKQVAEAYLSKTMTGKGYDAIAQAVADAGGAMKQDSFYRGSAPEKMIQAWKQGNMLGAVGNAAIAPFELAARPMMEHIVPMQKLGVFADLAQFELERLPAQATDAERRAVLAKVWDSVDNRMGQLVYDNMFWDRTFKDLAMASTRSVGWNVGTIRELGGAVADVATGKGLTHKVAYAASLPISVGMMGAVYQYLATGQGPQELKDYFYPKTGTYDSSGNPNRVQLPSYIRDVRDYATDVPKTLKHKVHPLLQIGWDWATNEDYRGDQIYNPDDSYVQNMQQVGSYFLKNASPFGISNLLEQQKRGASIGQQAAGFAGVTAAPRDVQMSRAQQLMSVLTRKGGGGLTPEDAEAQQQRRDALAQLRGGKDANAIDKALSSGALVPKQLEDLMRRAEIDPLEEKFKRLSLRDAMRVYKLGDQREQALWAEALDNKINAALNAGLSIPNP